MSTHFSAQGTCLCKSVAFSADAVSHEVGVCHCSMCRHWSGGPFIGVDCGDKVQFSGDVSHFDSSEWAERGFCAKCGTHLFYRLKANNQHIMPAGIFSEDSDLIMDHQIFIDEKPGYYEFSNKTKNMTGAEVFEQFMSSPSDD